MQKIVVFGKKSLRHKYAVAWPKRKHKILPLKMLDTFFLTISSISNMSNFIEFIDMTALSDFAEVFGHLLFYIQ